MMTNDERRLKFIQEDQELRSAYHKMITEWVMVGCKSREGEKAYWKFMDEYYVAYDRATKRLKG